MSQANWDPAYRKLANKRSDTEWAMIIVATLLAFPVTLVLIPLRLAWRWSAGFLKDTMPEWWV